MFLEKKSYFFLFAVSSENDKTPPMEDVDLTLKKKQTAVKKVPLAPTTTPTTPAEVLTPTDAAIKDPVAFLKNSMQTEYNKAVADKVTDGIRRDTAPPARQLQDLSDAHKLAEHVAATPTVKPVEGGMKKAAAAVLKKTEPVVDPESEKMLNALSTYGRYRTQFAGKMPDALWLTDAQFARLTYGDMLMKLNETRRAVNTSAELGNPITALLMIAVGAFANASTVMVQNGVLDMSYDMTGRYSKGVDLTDVIAEGVKTDKFKTELDQIYVEYADSFNMGPFQRLAVAIVSAASEIQKKNKNSGLGTASKTVPTKVPSRMNDL